MPYDPTKHHRRSVRLKGYDYSEAGGYFVTICVQGKLCLLGDVSDGRFVPSGAGCMVDCWWKALPSKFPSAELDEYRVMPNHLHGIIMIVGADPCVRPPLSVSPPLPEIVQWFKTMTTDDYIRGVKQDGWVRFPGRLWQRDYFDHVIRNDEDLENTRQYIADNPLKWALDEENPDAG
jgi:REP element-mobilizing transposase RayT